MNFLLDTCVVSDFFKKEQSVLKHFERVSPENIHISSITVMEIEYGLQLNEEKEKKIRPLWKNLLRHIHVLPYSPQCATFSAGFRARLKTLGLPIGPYDILIAGTALAHRMTIVTSNGSEFKRIKELTIQNWRES